MSLALQKAPAFVTDFERQYAWYVRVAGRGVADRYLAAVDNTLELVAAHPAVGDQRDVDGALWILLPGRITSASCNLLPISISSEGDSMCKLDLHFRGRANITIKWE